MANTTPKMAAPTDEEFSQMLENLEEEIAPVPQTKGLQSKGSKGPIRQVEQDILAELENLGAELPPSRPHTPRVVSSIKNTASPSTTSSRIAEAKAYTPRKSGESTRSIQTSSVNPEKKQERSESDIKSVPNQDTESKAGGGWWGSVFATATAAVKTAEAAVKEIQKNEEARRWADQVKDNVGALRGIGGQISSRALPTFTNILDTLAPPISSHEKLYIHITHDLINYPSLDPLIYSTFSRVMAQVEGGDLIVIQRGLESTVGQSSEAGYQGGSNSWNDDPWWRQDTKKRDIGAIKGLSEGTKLVRASAEAYANEYFNSHGGLDQAIQRATEDISETNPVRRSDIFIAVQAIVYNAPDDLFRGSTQEEETNGIVMGDEDPDELLLFAIYLHDPVHSITFKTLSQFLPARWIKWLDASSTSQVDSSNMPDPTQKSGIFSRHDDWGSLNNLPEEIAEIIKSGGVDPREWVSEWVEETLSLAIGIIAQRYIARRMGIEEGGNGKGKAKTEDSEGELN
ncbi:Maintenance of telomere capping protein 1 [Golovinomyces cichoracearum]|uniref:Maintenance of telomere capping protein 1 n=1 Tax=Golovinomyces cichoracearum TaxID=62708 RepID=A0A420ITR1_9PEZI|nr:Maintenance of telomere capping protein 1 [Golovinomyces cichoracearum]